VLVDEHRDAPVGDGVIVREDAGQSVATQALDGARTGGALREGER
jgi:hypothetical protein